MQRKKKHKNSHCYPFPTAELQCSCFFFALWLFVLFESNDWMRNICVTLGYQYHNLHITWKNLIHNQIWEEKKISFVDFNNPKPIAGFFLLLLAFETLIKSMEWMNGSLCVAIILFANETKKTKSKINSSALIRYRFNPLTVWNGWQAEVDEYSNFNVFIYIPFYDRWSLAKEINSEFHTLCVHCSVPNAPNNESFDFFFFHFKTAEFRLTTNKTNQKRKRLIYNAPGFLVHNQCLSIKINFHDFWTRK